jgi:hypothetical protein
MCVGTLKLCFLSTLEILLAYGGAQTKLLLLVARPVHTFLPKQPRLVLWLIQRRRLLSDLSHLSRRFTHDRLQQPPN